MFGFIWFPLWHSCYYCVYVFLRAQHTLNLMKTLFKISYCRGVILIANKMSSILISRRGCHLNLDHLFPRLSICLIFSQYLLRVKETECIAYFVVNTKTMDQSLSEVQWRFKLQRSSNIQYDDDYFWGLSSHHIPHVSSATSLSVSVSRGHH